MSRSPKHLVLHAMVIAAMAVGVTAFVSFDKAIALTVDGQTRTVHTFAKTVDGVLAREGINIGEHDIVAPAPSAEVGKGSRIAVRFGRQLILNVDGQTRKIWVTATSVDEALEQVGVRASGAYLSASRSTRIGREGLALTVRTPKVVNLVADGKKKQVITTAGTVRDAFTQAGITVGPLDFAKPPLDSQPQNLGTIQLIRVTKKRVTNEKVAIPFSVKRIKDSSLYQGQSEVEVKGVKGTKLVTYDLTSHDGKAVQKKVLAQKVVRQPTQQVVRVGTKVRPVSYGRTGVEDLNWAALADCESGGNPDAYNPAGYYGLYQFSMSTWRSVGGSGDPRDASASEQTYRAQILYKKAGAGQWPNCGKYLYS